MFPVHVTTDTRAALSAPQSGVGTSSANPRQLRKNPRQLRDPASAAERARKTGRSRPNALRSGGKRWRSLKNPSAKRVEEAGPADETVHWMGAIAIQPRTPRRARFPDLDAEG